MAYMTMIAVHLSDGVLTWPWLTAGVQLAIVLLIAALRRIDPDEIPRIALLGAAFFVSSLIHIRVGPTSVHLLFIGLLGLLLGRYCVLAIAVGLLMQCLMLGHGGWTTLPLNTVILSFPALATGYGFRFAVRELGMRPSFILGAVLGASAVIGAALLNFLVLVFGGVADWNAVAVTVLLCHLPVAAIEAVVLGSLIGFLVRVKPEWLGISQPINACQ